MKFGPIDTKRLIVTDFETFYDDEFTLRKMRNEEYINDSRFLVHGVAVAYPTGKTDFIERDDIPKWLRAHRDYAFSGHRATFDFLIWKLRYNHVPRLMLDTLFLANAVFGPAEVSGGNDLESVAERLGFQPKGRIEMFKGLREFSPEQHNAMRVYATNDADLQYKVGNALLPQISRPDFELWLLDHTLRIYITKPLPVRHDIAAGAIKKVNTRITAAISALPKMPFTYHYTKKLKRKAGTLVQDLFVKKVVDEDVLASNPQFSQALLQTMEKSKLKVPLKRGKNGMIPALAKNDEAFIALKSSKSAAVRSLVTARLAKKSGDTQIARLRALIQCGRDGGFRPYLNYWGSVTGRWSGGGGLNAHNFPNPSRSSDDFEREVATLIRETVVPPKGTVFTAVDAANIEARVLAWWAEQQDLVDAFGDGADVYSEFAADTFKEEVRKPTANDKPDVAKRFKLLRGAGKEAILGLGYGMGAPKMEMRMRSRPDVAPLFISGDLTSAKCEAIVAQYRGKYTRITALWGRVESAFFKAREGGKRMVNGVLFAPGAKRSVDVTLPTGRVIHYRNIRVGEHGSGLGNRKQWVHGHGKGKKLYGGLLVENMVQAMSRDILAEAVWAMEQEGYPVAYHVHDSVVATPKTREAKKALAFCIDVLSTAPDWAPGMRLGAEGAIEKVFA